jgi:hypothetical protein
MHSKQLKRHWYSNTLKWPKSLFYENNLCQFYIMYNVLMMVYNTSNHWVSGFYPSSGILRTRKQNVSDTGCVSVLKRREGVTYSVGSLKRAVPNSLHNSMRLTLPSIIDVYCVVLFL